MNLSLTVSTGNVSGTLFRNPNHSTLMNCMDSTTKTPSTRCYECGIIAGVVLEGLLGKVHGASIYIYIQLYTNTPKARFLTARTDFSFSQSLLRDLCWKHMKAPRRRLVWEKKLRHDITLEEAMAQFSHHIQNICRYVRYLSYFHYLYINTYYISNC